MRKVRQCPKCRSVRWDVPKDKPVNDGYVRVSDIPAYVKEKFGIHLPNREGEQP
jgi:hypothetical protein